MTLKDFEDTTFTTARLISKISKIQTVYFNRYLEKFNINITQLHLLFIISNNRNINQEEIANQCYINKGAVARSIKKLEDKNLITRKIDQQNRRQNKISLTCEGEKILNETNTFLNKWENEVYDKNIIDKELLEEDLKKIAVKSMEIIREEKYGEK